MIRVIQGQSLIDVAVSEFKNPLMALTIAFENGISITDELLGGIAIKSTGEPSDELFDFAIIKTPFKQGLNKVYTVANQSIIDVAIQEGGSPFSAIDWSFKNNVSLHDLLQPGINMKNPSSVFDNTEIRDYLKRKGQKVATYLNISTVEGLDYLLPGEFPYSF